MFPAGASPGSCLAGAQLLWGAFSLAVWPSPGVMGAVGAGGLQPTLASLASAALQIIAHSDSLLLERLPGCYSS